MLKRAFLAATLWTALSLGVSAKPIDLTILHTNDTHDHLAPYATRHGNDLGGIARRATLIREIKAQNPNVLVLDAGDTFQGTPIYTFYLGEADYLTMDQAGYDATTVGNHDLDNGLANLQKQSKDRKFLLINSNLTDKDGKPLFVKSHVFERGGLKVGVFGVLGEGALTAVASKFRKDFSFLPPLKIAQPLVDELRQKSDLVVMLSHSGLQEDIDFAKQVQGIDVIVGGHSHSKVEKPVEVVNGDWRTLVVQGFQWGEYLGRLDLTVDGKRIVRHHGELLPVTNALAEDKTVADTVASYNARIEKQMEVVIGKAPKGLSSEAKYHGDSELGNWTADLMRSATGADVGIMNSGGLRASLQPGEISVGEIYTIFPFDNSLVTVEMTGELLQAICDRAASLWGKQGFLQFSGLRFRIEDGKAVDLWVGDRPVDPKRTYSVATIDYIAQGNDRQELFTKATGYNARGVLLRDVVLEYVRKHSVILPPNEVRIVTPKAAAPLHH